MKRTVPQYIQDGFAAGSRPHPTQVALDMASLEFSARSGRATPSETRRTVDAMC